MNTINIIVSDPSLESLAEVIREFHQGFLDRINPFQIRFKAKPVHLLMYRHTSKLL